MRNTFAIMLEAAAIASSLSLDAFTAGFAYGSNKIKIPLLSIQIVTVICSIITGLSLFAGALLAPFLPDGATLVIAFAILFIIGAIKLLDSATKSVIRRYGGICRQFKGSLFNVCFIINLYADPENADIDASQTISTTEAAALALSLSLDGIAVGFGAALVNVNASAVVLWSLIANPAAIMLGCLTGERISRRVDFNISWIGGVVLIALAFSKLL